MRDAPSLPEGRARRRRAAGVLLVPLLLLAPALAFAQTETLELTLDGASGSCDTPDVGIESCVRLGGNSGGYAEGEVLTIEAEVGAESMGVVPIRFTDLFLPDVMMAFDDTQLDLPMGDLTGEWDRVTGELALDPFAIEASGQVNGTATDVLLTTATSGPETCGNDASPELTGLSLSADPLLDGSADVALVASDCVDDQSVTMFVLLSGVVTPVPEPGAGALGAAALGALGLLRGLRGRRRGLALAALAASLVPGAGHAGGGEDAPACPRFREASEGLPERAEWRSYPAFGDVNGDGHLDVAAHPRKLGGPHVWLGDGAGGWTHSSEGLLIPGGSCGVGAELADVDEDGHLDLVVADHCFGPFVFLGDGEGGWRLGPLVDPVDEIGSEDLAVGDVTGEGHLDLVTVGSFGGGLRLYAGDGAGGWERRREVGLPSEGLGRAVALGDVNGDGHLDLAAALADYGSGGPVWLGDGSGSFRPLAQEGAFAPSLRYVAFGDVNGDGHLDLAATADRYREGYPPIGVYLGDGDGGFRPALEGLPPRMSPGRVQKFHGVALGEVSGDGRTDLVAVEYDGASVRVWTGDGEGRWHACPETGPHEPRAGTRGWGVSLGDVDGDGRQDLAVAFGADGKRGSLEVWLQEAGSSRE